MRSLYLIVLILLLSPLHNVQAQQPVPEYTACQDCLFIPEKNILFYDDGGKSRPVSAEEQTTTFRSRTRKNEKLSLYFLKLDLPEGAYIKITYGDAGSEERKTEIFTHIRKAGNIIADEIIFEYFPAPNTLFSAGWECAIDVVYYIDASTLIPKPESDCPYAIPLCSNNTVVVLGGQYTDLGLINDDGGSCYSGTGSGGSVWFSFTPQSNGPLDFTIFPSGTTDYDFVLWDITNGCGNGQRVEIACNYSLYTGTTGLSGSKCNENYGDCDSWTACSTQSKGASCNRFNNRVNVQTNRKYALSVNFYSGANDGFILRFQNESGSVAITDNTPPTITNAYSNNCTSATSFQVNFSEWIDCSTLQNNDFTLAGHTFTITNNYCVGNRTLKIDLAVSPALGPGTWNIQATNILDLCGNMLNSIYPVVLGNPPNPNISAPTQVCKNPGASGGFSYAPNSQTLTASGGDSYIWSTGETSASISVSPRNTTAYTVNAIRGACVASASTTIPVVQASAVSLGPDRFYCGTPITLTVAPTVPGHTYQFFRNPTATSNGASIQNGPNPSITVSPTNTTKYRVLVTDLNGCRARADVRVVAATGSTATIIVPGNNFCKNSIPFQLTALPEGGTFSGPGIVGDMFDPALAGVGTHTISYTTTNECGTFSAERNVQVMNNNTNINFNLPSLFCVTDPDTAFVPNPRCGQFFGNGIVNPGVCNVNTYTQKPVFSPAIAGIGTHIITYDPPQNQGCTGSMLVTVVGDGYEPTISGLNPQYCANAGNVTLSGFPTGGVFVGPGISGNTFSPANAGVGTHNITYILAKCGNTFTTTATVDVLSSSPSASISYPGSPYCFTNNTPQSVQLTGTPGGTFSAPVAVSINASTGAITPASSTPGTYTVTYAIPAGSGCPAFSTTTQVTITNSITPTFNPIAPICNGAAASPLPGTSNNGIAGIWSPATVSNTASATYTFTPNPGQCATSTTLNVTVNNNVTPTFNPIVPFCSGAVAPPLPGTSSNGITGLWNPATVSNTASDTYTFTPNAGQCATTTTLNVTVNPNVTPTFNPITPFCSGAAAPPLLGTSTNGITGLWSPATVNNTTSGVYNFTPSAGQCATNASLSVTVKDHSSSTVNAQICTGQSYTLPDGSVVSAAGAYPVTLTAANGCDSVVTTNITVNNTLTSTINVSICSGQTYTLPDGAVVTAANSYNTTLTSVNGCDSIITTNLTVNPVYSNTVSASICSGQTYTLPDGSMVTAANSYTTTLSTVNGCDSVITTNLTVNPLLSSVVNTSICDGQSYTLPDGSVVSVGGNYSITLTSAVTGCDSVVTTNLTVNPVFSTTVDAQICTGQSYTLPDGSVVSAGGSYPVTLTAANGCDSVVTTSITVNNTLISTVDTAICQGDSYTLPDGTVVSAQGTYTSTFTLPSGCDSIVTTNLSINPVFSNTVDANICDGESYTLPDGSVVWANGSYTTTLSSVNGCDSVITTNLTVNPVLSSAVNVSICDGQNYTLPDGSVATAGGNYSTTLTSAVTGCDSVVTTNLTVNPVFSTTVDAQICTGQSYTLPDGSVMSAEGTYSVTLSSLDGCDSVISVNLVINNTLTTTVNAAICQGDSYTLPDGTLVSAQGTYTSTFTLPSGCDSIVTTNLTVNPVFSNTVDASICNGGSYALPDGSVVSASGSYVTTLSSVNGCDSVITTNLTVNPVLSSVVNASICDGDSYTLPDGSVVTLGGNYSTTLTSAATGCDSVVTTNLTVNPVFSTTVDAQICTGQSYTLPDGSVVSAEGTYSVTLYSLDGCDSVISVNLVINNTLTTTVDTAICQGDSYTLPDGTVVSAQGTYISTFTLPSGCDSIVTTNLTVNPVFSNTVDANICEGGSYTLPDGSVVSANGSYVTTLSSVNGCDSVITTNLTVNPVLSSGVNASICYGQSYTLPDGSVVTIGGNYATTLTSAATGCDSVVTTNLTVNSVFSTTVDAQICTGQSYTLSDGSVVSAEGTYSVTLSSLDGCDSVITVNLVINNTLTTTVNAAICQRDSYTLPDGTVVSAQGTYTSTFTLPSGCDSIVTTNLTVNPVSSNTVNASICDGKSYTLPDGSFVSANGSYTTTLSSVSGCDSAIITNLTVNPVLSSVVNASICDGQSYTLPDGSVVTLGGNYSTTLSSVVTGCDSVVATNLGITFIPSPFMLGPDTTICEGDAILIAIAQEPGNTYIWQDGSTNNAISVDKEGLYYVTATNSCGSRTDSIEIRLELCATCGVYVPNAFTPNGDGVNDLFVPITTCDNILPYQFRIYNRWNEMLFETADPSSGWDGKYKGKQQPLDVYIYYLSYFDSRTNRIVLLRGTVNLLR